MKHLTTTLHCIIQGDTSFILDVLKDLLESESHLEINPNHLVFILKKRLDIAETYETLQLLQDDLGITLNFYSGFTHIDEASIYKEAKYAAACNHKELYSSLYQNYALTVLPRHGLDQDLFKGLKHIVNHDTQTRDIICKLWKTQGNIAQSASELYLHRNTLIYRIDKFRDFYYFDLKDPFELLLLYLITL